MAQLHEIADIYRLGPSTGTLVAAARQRRIPVTRLTPTGSLVQLGWGMHQHHRGGYLPGKTSHQSVPA
ncbi:MAG: hypothetical protein H0X24_03510 [Ktedonobacterales bacterium]|nr:hypothetical protein [Ktedonobacterales bacterium]